jgi:DNA-binding NarL/FixJ family response regulator
MKRTSFAIDVVEAGYRLDGTEEDWFDRVLERLAPELSRGLGTIGLTYSFEGERLVLGHLFGRACPAELLGFARMIYENVPPDASRAIQSSAGELRAFSEFARRFSPEEQEGLRVALRQVGLSDSLVVGYPDGNGGWIAFAALSEGPTRTFSGQRAIWRRVCAHLATAWRLRQRVGSAKDLVEAIMSPRGRVLSASGVAKSQASRERLTEAADALGKARGALRARDPLAAMDLWKGLVSGRWSLVERVDSDGTTTLLAHENEPQTPDPRGLSPRERAIVELALTGASNKHIAYSLGLGPGTVAKHLQQATAKLGVESRVALMRLARVAGAEAPRAVVAGEELGLLVIGSNSEESLPLTDAERDVARLVAQGLTNAEIASRRGSAQRTVVNQIASIYEKLRIGSRPELVLAMTGALPPA